MAALAIGKNRSERARPRRTKGKLSSNIIVYERRILIIVTIFVIIGMILWVVCISTDHWYTLSTPNAPGIFINTTGSGGHYFLRGHGGLWRVCRTENHPNGSNKLEEITICKNRPLFPSREDVEKNDHVDQTLLDYTRTQTAFSIITLLLMSMGLGFSMYTFREHRYMYKRLAGGVHFLTAATILVVIEVLANSVKYASINLPARIPMGTMWHYGYSYVLAWISFVSSVLAGLAFIICSRKRKGDKGRGGDIHTLADEPHILGR